MSYTDQFGAGHGWTSPGQPVTIALQLSRPAGDLSQSFSPGGDGQEDTVTAPYCMTDDANVTITVHNAANALVRTLQTSTPVTAAYCYSAPYVPYDNMITWDGKDTGGNVVVDGDYTIQIHAVAGADVSDVSIPTTVDTRLPGALTTPAPNATLGDTADFVFTPTSGFSGIQQVSVDCINAASTSPEVDGTYIGSGDTNSCLSGAQELHSHVYWIDQYGSQHFWTSPDGVPVTIAPTFFLLQIGNTGSSTAFSPNGDGQDDVVTQRYCLTGDAAVDAVVKNAGNTVVRTLLTGDAQTATSCAFNGNNSVTWDGKDDAGHVVANGAYSIAVHAVAVSNSTVADLSIPTTVDNRMPGQLNEPFFGETLQGLVHFSFTPTAGFQGAGQNTISSIQGCFSNDGTCISILNASGDGVWRTTKPASQLHTGGADFTWSVAYTDTYGQPHSFTSPVPVALSINSNPNPVLAVGASPSSGPAPLATTLHFDLADAAHRPIAYSVDFGDGSAHVTGTSTAPYTGGVSLAHTYSTPGSFLATVSVSDGIGGSAQKSVNITASGTEAPPVAALSVSPTAGTAPTLVTATFAATDADSPTLTYSLDFGDGSAAVNGTLPDGPIDHTYLQPGTYTVRFAASDGVYTDMRAQSVSVGLSEPLVAKAGDDQTAIVNHSVHFDGSASRPLVGITGYSWAFSDGGTANTEVADHTFTTTGTKTATLTVHAGAVVSHDTMKVVVLPVPVTPGLHVTVTGGAAPVQGADVLVLDSDGARHATTTDNTGAARIDGLPDGKFTVYAWHDGFLPDTASTNLVNGSGSATITLAAGSVGQTSMTSTPITDLGTLQSLGIDPNDAANQNVYQFEIHLAFVDGGTTHDVALGGYASGSGILGSSWTGASGGDCTAGAICAAVGGDYTVYPEVGYVGSTPTVLWMVIPGCAKWLKEFFDVRVVVSNLGSSAFSFQHGTASLGTLPAGLSLAPTAVPQSLDHAMPDIPGGGSAEADWVVRGDSEGFYTLGAQYSGSLEPLGTPVHLIASTAPNALHVWGGSALHMTVDTDATAVIGAPYRVRIQLTNVADVPVFNPSIELLTQGRLNYIYQPGEKLLDGTDVIQPGATFSTHFYRLVPEISGTLVQSLSFVKKTAGNTDVASTIVSHAAVAGLAVTGTHSGTSLTLTWNAPSASGISGYQVFFTASRDTLFGATPVKSTNASTHTATITNAAAGYYVVSTLVSGVPTMFHTMYGLATSPVVPTAVPANGGALVKWTAPQANGGSAITGYVVTPVKAGVAQAAKTLPASVTSQLFTGLVNGASYTFKVAAKNANGTGPPSVTAAIVIGAPTAPTAVKAVSSSTTGATGSLAVTFTIGGNNGVAITKSTATCTSSNGGATKTAVHTGATAATITVTGVGTAKTYTCKVTSTNSRGIGPAGVSGAVTVGAPAPPATPTVANVGSGQLRVTFTTPATNGAGISGYSASCTSSNGGAANAVTGASSPIAVTGLTASKIYTCTVAATNSRGDGPPSPASTAVAA